MKKIVYTLFAAVTVLAASINAYAQTEQTRDVRGFKAVASAGSFNVHVKIDGTESLKINADADIINDIETVVENGTLQIGFKNSRNWHMNTGKIEVYITAKSLSGLAVSGSGSIKVEGLLTGEDVKLNVSGSGNITSGTKASEVHVDISGSGHLDLEGSANDTRISMSGSGSFKGRKFTTATAIVDIAGSGSVYLDADKTIAARIAGSGHLTYSGNAAITESHTVGSGRITKTSSIL